MRKTFPMRLLLIRHGRATDREVFAKAKKDDALRPLTPEGQKKMKLAASDLRKICRKIDLIATSPMKRAMQTAEIIYTAYNDKPQFVELPLLPAYILHFTVFGRYPGSGRAYRSGQTAYTTGG